MIATTNMDTFIAALGWGLLHFVWQGLMVGAAAGLLLVQMRNASPRKRYAVCALALATCLGLPLLQLGWMAFMGADSATEGLSLTGAQPDALQELEAQLSVHLPALVVAWSLGVGLMGLRLGLGLLWVGRVRRSATAAPAAWQTRLNAVAQRLGLQRKVLLQLLPDSVSPITVGFWRPVVMVPAALLSGMPVALLEALLAHELAHVRRWDYLANLLQNVAEALLFFHPVVWWLSSRMRVERELVADELAAQALDDPRRLALALHALSLLTAPVEAVQPVSLALSARGGSLLQRMQRLLAPAPQTSSWKLAMPALLLAASSLLVHANAGAPQHNEARAVSGTVAPAPSIPAVAVNTSPAPSVAVADAAVAVPVPVAAPMPAPALAPSAAPQVTATPLLQLPFNAKHALVLEEGSGRVVMAKDADAVVPIASLTKLMTAMVVLDAKQDPNERLHIAPEDVDTLKHSSSRVAVGAEMQRQAALKLALVSSENRAAAALARTFPGGSTAFFAAMQAKIRSLGLTHTTIGEPTGLSPANTSTATEVAKIAEAAARYPEIARITSERVAEVAVNGRARELHNTNRLVGGSGWDIRLSKTGYTEEAGRCLTMRMKSGVKTYTVVLLDANGSAQRLRDASKIRQTLLTKHPA